jgi:hypothetical protein
MTRRYDFAPGEMEESTYGDWVSHDDYMEMVERVQELEEEVEQLKTIIDSQQSTIGSLESQIEERDDTIEDLRSRNYEG